MKKLFEIDWSDNYGPNFINSQYLLDFMETSSHVTNRDIDLQVRDVTPKEKIAPPLGGHDF